MKSIQDLINEMCSQGVDVNNIIIDNKIHRCTEVNGRSKHKKPCWYIVFNNGSSIVAAYGNFKNCIHHVWSNNTKISRNDRLIINQQINLSKQHQLNEQQQHLVEIRNRYCKFTDLNIIHPYIAQKSIAKFIQINLKHRLKIDSYGNLVIPIFNMQNILMGYQTISEIGKKLFTKGTCKRGNYYPIMTTSVNFSDVDIIAVGEGLATMASVYIALTDLYGSNKIACLVAFDVGNIEAVLLQLWRNHINKSIILVADNDIANTTNVGVNTCINIQNKYRHKPINVFIPHEV